MRPPFFILSLGLLLLGASGNLLATSTNTPAKGPAENTKVLIRMTVLGISEGVLYGSTVNNAGESIGFTSDTVGTNDTIFAVVNPNSAKPSLYQTNGDFSSATNVPPIPKVHSRFTEITGYSQGIVVGNYASASGSRAFIVPTNGNLSHFSYPGARPATTVITGISQGMVVGTYLDDRNALHGFSYTPTNSSYNRIDEPQGIGRTHVHGISEGVIYGSFVTAKGITSGFTYSNGAYTTNSVPGAAKFTEITGYSQGSVAGNFLDTNRVHGGFYFDGTNYSQADVGTTGYSRIAGFNQDETAGNFLETNGVMYYTTSTNVVNNRSIFLTTNYWQTTLAAYPPHPTSKQPTKYIPPASTGGNSGVTGSTITNGATGIGGSVTMTLGSSNTYTGITKIGAGTLTLSGSNTYSGNPLTNEGNLGDTNTGSTNNNGAQGASNSFGSGSLTLGTNNLDIGSDTNISFGVTGLLTNTGSATNLITIGGSAPSTAYYSGGFGTAWTNNNGIYGNFTTDGTFISTHSTNNVQAWPSAASTIIFNNKTNVTLTLGQTYTVSSLFFSNTGSVAIIGDGNTLNVTGALTVASNAAAVNLGNNLTGTGTLTINGSNTLTLSGSNSYTGPTVINNGTLNAPSINALGSSTVTLNASGTLSLGATNVTNPINGLVFSPDTNTSSLTISNFGSSDYILGNFGSSNSLIISPGASDTISFGDYTGTNSDIALTLTKNGVTNPTGGAFLILPGTNKVEFLLP